MLPDFKEVKHKQNDRSIVLNDISPLTYVWENEYTWRASLSQGANLQPLPLQSKGWEGGDRQVDRAWGR